MVTTATMTTTPIPIIATTTTTTAVITTTAKEKAEQDRKRVKTDFIQDYCNRAKRAQYRARLNCKGSMGKWGFIAMEQVRVSGWKTTNRKIRGEGFLAKLTSQDSC